MELSNIETNVLLVALDHMEEHLTDIQDEVDVEDRLKACRTIITKIKQQCS
jgi:hypothetical protein